MLLSYSYIYKRWEENFTVISVITYFFIYIKENEMKNEKKKDLKQDNTNEKFLRINHEEIVNLEFNFAINLIN
jgi:hypothetical protein